MGYWVIGRRVSVVFGYPFCDSLKGLLRDGAKVQSILESAESVMLKMRKSVEVFHLGCKDGRPIDAFSKFWIYHVNVTQETISSFHRELNRRLCLLGHCSLGAICA